MNDLLAFAEKMLREYKEFLPFGGHMKFDGTIVWEGGHDGKEQPPSQALIDLLREAHQEQARSRSIKACATVYDIRTAPPGRSEKQDAIAVALDHENGYSVLVVFPTTSTLRASSALKHHLLVKGQGAIFGEARA